MSSVIKLFKRKISQLSREAGKSMRHQVDDSDDKDPVVCVRGRNGVGRGDKESPILGADRLKSAIPRS